jgi:hypothetical protein
MSNLITAHSIPDLDNWGPDTYWSCFEWVEFHKALVKEYGLQKANQIFAQEWRKQDSWASPYNWCKYDQSFVNYFKSQGIEAGHIFSNFFLDAADTVDNVADTVKRTSGLLKAVLPIAVVALLLFFAYNKAK